MQLLSSLRGLCTAALFAGALSAQVSYFSVSLDGAQEVPANATTGGGYGIVRLDQSTNVVRIFAHYFGTTGVPTAAHMHQGAVGANGGVIVPLAASAPGVFTGTGTLTAPQVVSLLGSGMYLNVHTAAFPGGEIRGQVVSPTSTRFLARLGGGQEVPPNASTAQGLCTAFLHEPDNRLVYMVDSNGLANVTAAHLHSGAAGVAGPVLFPLNGAAGNYCGVSPRLTATQVAALMADATYLNIHTAAFPGGEIRGQMRKDLGSLFAAELDGASQVPANAVAGLGSASLEIGPDGNATITVSYGGLTGAVTASHIHNAPIGVNGPVSVPLVPSGTQLVASFVPTAVQLAQLRAGDWYVNIHTAAFPGGEIRGQLHPAKLPTTFGPTCLGSSGQRPEIGASSFPGLGTSVDIEVYGALPGAPSFLVFGLNRDSASGSPLPLGFTAVGLNAPCFFVIDPIANRLAFADARGCASVSWNVPFNTGLRGVVVCAQWVLVDGAANPAGFVSSNGLSMLVQ